MRLASTCALVALLTSVAFASEIDFEIGVDDNNRLSVVRPAAVEEPYELLLVVGGDLTGSYISIEPGWDGLAEALGGLAPLDEQARVALERVDYQAGFAVLDLAGQPLLPTDGDQHEFVGAPEDSVYLWHEHLLFSATDINEGETITGTFRVVDLAGVHTPSETFTLTFVGVDAPNTGVGICGIPALLMLGVPMIVLTRMRSRLA